jgi:hypothetical protein
MTTSSQSDEHAGMNARIKKVLNACLWVVRFEELHTDIAAFRPGCSGVWALESERRAHAYWISRNAMRNERNGAIGIVFVAETIPVAEKIQRIVGRLPDTVRKKTLVVPLDGFTEEFVHNNMERRQ